MIGKQIPGWIAFSSTAVQASVCGMAGKHRLALSFCGQELIVNSYCWILIIHGGEKVMLLKNHTLLPDFIKLVASGAEDIS